MSNNTNVELEKSTWFPTVFEIDELSWKWDIESLSFDAIMNMGHFEIVEFNTLLNKFKEMKFDDTQAKTIHIITRSDWTHEEHFDTSSLQANGPSKALYQVASNFNCLEVASERHNPFTGTFISHLMFAKTQGPSAACGCAYGTATILATHRKEPNDLFKNLPPKVYDIVNCTNGKLIAHKQNQMLGKVLKSNMKHISIGLLRGTRACFDRNGNSPMFKYSTQGPIIDQLFTSTCILTPNNARHYIDLQRVLLQVAYDSVYLAAIVNKNSRIVLTLIGGGVFNNMKSLIYNAIITAHMKYSAFLPKECNVYLPIYEPIRDHSILTHFDKISSIVNHVHYKKE